MEDIYIKAAYNLHGGIRAYVKEDKAGDYTIFVNETLSDEAKEKALAHELQHIRKRHFQQTFRPVASLEKEISAKKLNSF